MNINDGEELLQLGDGFGNTSTNVRDLYIIRIVRFQCNCDGSCCKQISETINNNSKICTDKIVLTRQDENQGRKLQCSLKTGPTNEIV